MEEKKNNVKGLRKTKKEIKAQQRRRWVISVTIGTFFSTMLFSYVSDLLTAHTSLLVSLIILLAIITIGIFTDVLGIAVASADLEHFNAMASRKIPGAKTAVNMVKNAPRVSSLCNDVIGDICGIVSGATSVAIVAQMLVFQPGWDAIWTGLLVSGAVASLTVGGKACGKDIGMNNSTAIIHAIAQPLAAIKKIFTGTE